MVQKLLEWPILQCTLQWDKIQFCRLFRGCPTRICFWTIVVFSIHWRPWKNSHEIQTRISSISADDTLIYGHCINKGTEKLQMRVSECVDEIASWMGANCLKINSEKTVVSWFSCRRKLENIHNYSLIVLKSNILHKNMWGTWESIWIETSRCQRKYQKPCRCVLLLRQIRSFKRCLTINFWRHLHQL